MARLLRMLTGLAAAGSLLVGVRTAMAASPVHGVAFAHGTGDYPGTQSCSGTSTAYKCVVQNAVDNYWSQAEVDSVRGGRPYVVTGHHGGTMTPWANASPYKNSGGETTTGTAYEVAAQLNRFLAGPNGVYGDGDDITDLVVVTHSGGSNVLRYIVQHPTINTDFTHVQARLRKIIGVAPPSRGTYLADRVFANDGSLLTLAGSALASLMGFKDDGTLFITTTSMTSQNGDNAKLGNSGSWNSSTQGGVPFYTSGGLARDKCFGVTLWGKCLGVTAGSLGGSNCDSFLMDTGLAALHNAFLNTNDGGTARNKCSDGFISCASSQAIGTQFGFDYNQDHNQSRRKCNGEDSKIAAQVNNAQTGFENEAYSAADVAVSQWDSCGFSVHSSFKSGGTTVGYNGGCAKTDLGDGWCDWDCIATYGRDAAPTWDATGTKVLSWGATDDCTGTLATGTAPQGFSDTNNPWATGGYYAGDPGTYTSDGATWYYTAFTGKIHNGDATVWYTDPNNGTMGAIGYCPSSLIGDGVCDECVLAQYGNDGNDCLPGKVKQCGGIFAKYDTAGATTNNPIYNERMTSSTWTQAFNQTNTATATQNTKDITFWAVSGQTITVSTSTGTGCNLTGVSGVIGDTYIRLIGVDGTSTVASSDDACTTSQSYFSYTAATTGQYTVKLGCFSTNTCSGTAAYSVTGRTMLCNTAGGVVGNGVCDIGECTRNKWNPCGVDADCSTGTCSGGYCADSASTCNASTDCTSGTCVNGGCTTAGSDCSTTKSDGTVQSLCR